MNLEELYSQRKRDIDYNPGVLEKDLDLIPFDQLTDRQKCILHKDKIAFFNWMFAEGEKIAISKRQKSRVKCIKTTYRECHVSKPYEERNRFIEGRIEAKYKYFDSFNDLNPASMEIFKLREKLYNVKLALRNQQGRVPKEKVMS